MSIKNVKLTIQYDGTRYSGWQIQKEQDTIQGELKKCIGEIVKEDNVNIIGSGRTDSGVHALGQVANFKVNSNMSDLDFKNAINAKISKDIRIIKVEIVDDDFNSRFSAFKREYVYIIKKKETPFDYNYHWSYRYDFDIQRLNKCADIVLNNTNFSNFCRHSPDIDNYLCLIDFSKWEIDDDWNGVKLTYKIRANRFLHHMVRMIVGTMLEVSRNRISIKDFEELFNENSKNNKVLTAPSTGLYLSKVYYE